ncbi:MAG: DUF5060 domain-containing protein [Bacteroidota bacterium]|nr:DUF5060 domain-containing protein [Bacteroidota bacterium]
MKTSFNIFRKFLLLSTAFLFPIVTFSQQHFETKVLRNLTGDKIAQYETIEIGVRTPAMERSFRMFLDDQTKGLNPYKQHFLRMQFVCNNKTYIAQAFYMQDAIADDAQNKYVVSESEWPWRIRFAVPDTGKWTCNMLVGETAATSVPQASGISFTCVAGAHHGYIQVAPDRKHFQYSDGVPFFVLGQNITCADQPVLRGVAGPTPVYLTGYYDIYHYMNDLADKGGNYVRIGMAPWSTGIDYQANGIYLQDRACALDSMIRIAEARGLHVQLAIDLTKDMWKDHGQGYWSVVGPSPFKKPGMTEADLLNDSAALDSYEQYVRYVYARWGFSPAVASLEILGEQDRWEGYGERKKYFTDFILHVDSLLKNEFGDYHHMISTSTTNADHYEVFRNSAISFADRHHYDNDFKSNRKRYAIVHQRSIVNLDKPFLFGEMGMINGPYNDSDADDFEYCNDISYHNALWSTMFMGGAGAGLYWWQWKNDLYRAKNFPAMRFFLDSVLINQANYEKFAEWDGNGLETFYQVDEEENTIAGWVHNTSYWWGNLMHDCRDRNGKEKILPKDNDKAGVPENRSGNIFIVKGLKPGKTYTVNFYDTRVAGHLLQTLQVKANLFGKMKIPMPDQPDCAFKIHL